MTGNTVKMNSMGGISIWSPTQNALVQNNRILGQGDYAFASFWSNGTQFLNNRVDGFLPNGKGVYDAWGGGWPPYAVPAARGLLYSSDSNIVQGIGRQGPLDVVIFCGQNNQVTNMKVQSCPAAPAAAAPAASASRAVRELNSSILVRSQAHLK